MDLTPFKMDIDELVNEYDQKQLTTFAEMKRVWMGRKFSYIYEARPKTNAGFFMQTLFAYSLSHMVSSGSLSRRLGGLYCLYALYEIQPYKPPFKIYLSLGELKSLKNLVSDAKGKGITATSALVKKMLKNGLFLIGFADIAHGSVASNQKADDIAELQNKRDQVSYEKLLGNTRIEDYLHMNLAVELDLQKIKKMTEAYAKAKELAIRESSHIVDVSDIEHITENKKLLGDRLQEIVDEWDEQKKAFYEQMGTGTSRGKEIVAVDDSEESKAIFDK